MQDQRIVAGLDLGSSTIKCVVGVRRDGGVVDIIGTGEHPADGFEEGEPHVEVAAIASVRAAVERAELMAGCDLGEVCLGVSGRHVDSFNSSGLARILGDRVALDDLERAVDLARAVKIPAVKQILHVAPQRFVVDGSSSFKQPIGSSGVRLELSARVVLGHTRKLQALESVCTAAGLNVVDIFCGNLARGEALVPDACREMGVALVDLGADTTELSVFMTGGLVYSASLPIGGDLVTADVKDCLNTPLVDAERLKQASGHAMTGLVDTDTTVEVPGIGGRKARRIKRSLLCEIIEARVQEIFELVGAELAQSGFDGLAGGVILTGGGANLEGIIELAEHQLRLPATLGRPVDLSGLVDVVCKPRFSTAVGLARCGLEGLDRDWFSSRLIPAKRRGGWRRILRR